jgi:Restriction endonuclease
VHEHEAGAHWVPAAYCWKVPVPAAHWPLVPQCPDPRSGQEVAQQRPRGRDGLTTPSCDPNRKGKLLEYIRVECKNWSKPVGVSELRSFLHKVERKFDRCRLGLVAPGGFTGSLQEELRGEKKGDKLIVLLDGGDLAALVASGDSNETTARSCSFFSVALNGHGS